MNKIKIGAQVTAKVRHTNVTVSGTFQGYELEDQEDPTSVCGKVFYVKDGMQHLDYVYVDSIKVCKGEDEDERIRKELIEYLTHRSEVTGFIDEDKDCKRWIAYLEKQKEQKPAESDAIKGGDFISDGKRVFLVLANVKERNLGETGSTFCEGHILGVDGVVYCDGDNFKKFKRATSDERAKFIHDLKVGVELKEQLAEWSDKDESYLQTVIDEMEANKKEAWEYEHKKYDTIILWLKSLRPQPKQEWSEEDKTHLGWIIECFDSWKYQVPEFADQYQSAINFLKSLRPQPHWKPSKEQMDWLESAVKLSIDKPHIHGIIISLYEQLKRL